MNILKFMLSFMLLASINLFSMDQSQDSQDLGMRLLLMEREKYRNIIDEFGEKPPMESFAVAQQYYFIGKRSLDHRDNEVLKNIRKYIRKADDTYHEDRGGVGKKLQKVGLLKPKQTKQNYFQENFSTHPNTNDPLITLFCKGKYRFWSASLTTQELLDQGQKPAIIRLLLENGCDPNPRDHPLVVALGNKNPGAIELLLRHGSHLKEATLASLMASENFDTSPFFSPSLKRMRQELMFKATKMGSISIMQQLIELEGADVIENEIGHTLFYVLKKIGKYTKSYVQKQLSFLLSQGANPFYESYPPATNELKLKMKGEYKSRKFISPYRWLSSDHVYDLDCAHPKKIIKKFLKKIRDGRKAFLWPQVIHYAALIKWIVEKENKWLSILPKDVALLIGTYCCDGYPAD